MSQLGTHPVDGRESAFSPRPDAERQLETGHKSYPITRMARKRERMRAATGTRQFEASSKPEDRIELKMQTRCQPESLAQVPGDDSLKHEHCDRFDTSLALTPSSFKVMINMRRVGEQKQPSTRTTASTRLAATFFLLALGLVCPNWPSSCRFSSNLNAQNRKPLQFGSANICDRNQFGFSLGFVLVASAEGAPEIGSLRTYWRRHQQMSPKNPAPPPAQEQTLSLDESNMKPNKPPIPIYTRRPEAQLRLREGSRHALRCATKERMKSNYWTKDGEWLFDMDMGKVDTLKAERFTFIGDKDQNDYSIELRNAQVNDTGVYKCHTYNTLLNAENEYDFLVMSNLTVEPAPSVTQSPSALESDLDDQPEQQQQQQQHLQHSQRSTVITHATMPQSFQSDSTLQTYSLVQPPASHTLTRLPPPTRLFSNRNTSTTSLKMDARLTMPFVWPYILLALAAILMLTNVYLIYSLVRRHTRRRRSDVESPSPRERKLSSSSSSGVGSGQGSTSVHKLTK